jgi:hypothetical protein
MAISAANLAEEILPFKTMMMVGVTLTDQHPTPSLF